MPDDVIKEAVEETQKKDINDFEGLDGDELHDAMMAQAEEEIQAEKEGRDPIRVLDKQNESSESKDGEGKSKDDDEQGDDDQGKDDDANEDEDADKDEDSEDDDSDDDSENEDEEGDEEDLDKEISEHAEKEGMNYADAKEDLEKTKRIIEQYGNDPKKMAKAMREKDREYQKLRVEKEKAEKKEPMFVKKSDSQFLSEAKQLLSNPTDTDVDEDGVHIAVSNYRKKWPARTESLTDEAVIELVAEEALQGYKVISEKKEKEIETTADKRRDEFISSLSKEDRRFIPEIKAVLSKTDKVMLAEEDFNFKDIVDVIKGRSYDADVKAAFERGKKAGIEKPKIAGVQSAKGGSNNGRPKEGASVGLNERQKKRAVEMYGNSDFARTSKNLEQACYEMYIDTFKDRIKDDPKFV